MQGGQSVVPLGVVEGDTLLQRRSEPRRTRPEKQGRPHGSMGSQERRGIVCLVAEGEELLSKLQRCPIFCPRVMKYP